MKNYAFHLIHIYNMDEIGISTVQDLEKINVSKVQKWIESVTS